jgi:Protein of unknown function (DUF3309)
LFLTSAGFQSREPFPKKAVLETEIRIKRQEKMQMLTTILLVILILMLIGALPTWGYSSGWGYGPGGIVGLLLIVVIVLALTGRI